MNNRPQKTEVYKCDICEEEFESEQELKEHVEDCACSETGNEEDDAGENESEEEDENDEELPSLTGEESAEDADEGRSQKNISDRNRGKGQEKRKR